MEFDFISDNRFRDLLESDYKELESCYEHQLSKSVMILSGSIIEACLIEYYVQNIPAGMTETQVLKMSLGSLIGQANQDGILDNTNKNLASVIQNYRNLIHPGRVIRKGEEYDFDKASIAKSLVSIVIKSLRKTILEATPLSADEIFKKLKEDSSFTSIYGDMIIKLSQPERNKLFDKLYEYEVGYVRYWDTFAPDGAIIPNDHYTEQIEDVKHLISVLKPLLQSSVNENKLAELVKEIQSGDKVRSFMLFNFLHEDVDKLGVDEQELIAIYFLSFFGTVLDEVGYIAHDKTYSTIGKYIHSQKSLDAFEEFTNFCIANFGGKYLIREMDVFEQALNSLKEEHKTVICTLIKDVWKNYFALDESKNDFIQSSIDMGIIEID